MGGFSARKSLNERRRDSTITTPFLILVALRRSHPEALSSYQLALSVTDDQIPPRPLSVLIKNLSKDAYIAAAGKAGKRAAIWVLSPRGLRSLERRAALARAASQWLDDNPNYSPLEPIVLQALAAVAPASAARLVTVTGLTSANIRTTLKRLTLRAAVSKTHDSPPAYELTAAGRKAALTLKRKARNARSA